MVQAVVNIISHASEVTNVSGGLAEQKGPGSRKIRRLGPPLLMQRSGVPCRDAAPLNPATESGGAL
jgi:hypothetical protein